MASDTDDVQPAYMAVPEEKLSFAIRAYIGPQASWHRYRCFSGASDARHRNFMEGGYRYMMVLHGSPLILELLYSSLSIIIRTDQR